MNRREFLGAIATMPIAMRGTAARGAESHDALDPAKFTYPITAREL